MARIFQTGFEMGLNDLSSPASAGVSAAYTRPVSGVYGMRPSVLTYHQLPTGKTEIYTRQARIENAGNTSFERIRFMDNSSNILMSLSFGVGLAVVLRIGASIVQTSTFLVASAEWHLWEVYYKLADSGGRVTVKVDGTQIIDYTGDTNPGAATEISRWGFQNNATADAYIDDLACNDVSGGVDNSWCGDGRIISLAPNADGDSSQWVGSDANSVNNYLLVDEVPAQVTDYTESPTSGNKDFYNLASPAAFSAGDTIGRIWVEAYGQRANAATDQPVQLGVKSGGTESFAASVDLPTNPIIVKSADFLTDPSTGSPWTELAMASLQVGLKVP